jgi:hypothetical protein
MDIERILDFCGGDQRCQVVVGNPSGESWLITFSGILDFRYVVKSTLLLRGATRPSGLLRSSGMFVVDNSEYLEYYKEISHPLYLVKEWAAEHYVILDKAGADIEVLSCDVPVLLKLSNDL